MWFVSVWPFVLPSTITITIILKFEIERWKYARTQTNIPSRYLEIKMYFGSPAEGGGRTRRL